MTISWSRTARGTTSGRAGSNTLYTRVVPEQAVEMTAALLDRTVARTLERHRSAAASLQQRQDLAAVIHLCGSGAGNAYARRAFRLRRGQRCGDHDARRYLAEVNAVKLQFARLAAFDRSHTTPLATVNARLTSDE